MSPETTRDTVRRFYDTYGWKKSAGQGRYRGEILHEDLDEVTQRYMDDSEMRYGDSLGGGRLLLDAGCGAKPRVRFSRTFQFHVCVDVSLIGLQEARSQAGDRGRYVVADLAALPFRDRAFDGVLASHCLYHVHRDLQPIVLAELYRVTRTRGSILVFYASNYNVISLLHAGRRLFVRLMQAVRRTTTGWRAADPTAPPPLYYYTHNPARLARGFESVDITCLRTFTRIETELLRRWRLAPVVVPVAAWLERTFPHGMRYIGKYVTLRIQRTDGPAAR